MTLTLTQLEEARRALDLSTRGLLFILFGLIGLAIVIIVGSSILNQLRNRSRNR